MKKILFLITTIIFITGCSNKSVPTYTTYTNNTLGYTLEYPTNWILTEIETQNLVKINPENPEIIKDIITPVTEATYITITPLSNSIDKVRYSYKHLGSGRDMDESIIDFNGKQSYFYTPSYDQSNSDLTSREILLEHNKNVISIYTHKYNMPEVKNILNSIKFL